MVPSRPSRAALRITPPGMLRLLGSLLAALTLLVGCTESDSLESAAPTSTTEPPAPGSCAAATALTIDALRERWDLMESDIAAAAGPDQAAVAAAEAVASDCSSPEDMSAHWSAIVIATAEQLKVANPVLAIGFEGSLEVSCVDEYHPLRYELSPEAVAACTEAGFEPAP